MKSGYKNYIRFIKILSITATVCTIILGLGLICSSLIPASTSGTHTQGVVEKLDETIQISSKYDNLNKTEAVNVNRDKIAFCYYVGEKFTPEVKFLPSGTDDTSVTLALDDESIATIDGNGIVFKKKGNVKLKVYLSSDNAVYDEVSIFCAGEDVFDSAHPERLKFGFNVDCSKENIVNVGESAKIIVNEDKTASNVIDYEVENPEVLTVYEGRAYGVKEGTTKVFVNKTNGKSQVFGTFSVTVKASGKTPINSLEIKDTEFINGEKLTDMRDLFVIKEGFEKSDYDCIGQSFDSTIIFFSGNAMYFNNPGTVKIKFTSIYNPSVFVEKTVTVKHVTPTSAKIVGNTVIMPNQSTKFTFYHSPKKYSDCVKWSVVQGNATISEDGVLVAKWYGKVVLRGQSTIDENLVVEKTVEVKMFSSAYYFVRKLMGHFGLNALWGLGIFATLLFMCKRKYFTFLSPICTLSLALFTEFLQYFTPGRMCLITDVAIDFCGSLIGIGVAVVLFALVFLIFRLVGKDNYRKLVNTIKVINLTNVFKSTETIENLLSNKTESEVTAISCNDKNDE